MLKKICDDMACTKNNSNFVLTYFSSIMPAYYN